MSTLRLQQEAALEAGSSEEADGANDDDDDIDNAEEEDDDDDGAQIQDGMLLPPSTVDPLGRGHGRQVRKPKDPSLPSKGAAAKAAAEGDDRGLKERVAAERQRRASKEAKHHGRKAHAGKTGRPWAPGSGGKAKTSDKALVFNSMHF